MTISASTRIRAFGGASAFALIVGLGAAGAAQANAPVAAAPVPATPAAPAPVNTTQCRVNNFPFFLVCEPGTDTDGRIDLRSSTTLTIEAGAQVQGDLSVFDNNDILVDGDIVNANVFGVGLEIRNNNRIVNNGLIQMLGDGGAAIVAGDGTTLTNNGVINTQGDNFADAVSLGDGAVLTNLGDIITTGLNASGAFVGEGSLVTNDGRVITGADGALGVFVGANSTFVNNGLVQTFGDGADALTGGANVSVTNGFGAFLFTTGDDSNGIVAGDNADVRNFASAQIFTFGDDAEGVEVGSNSFVETNGNIVTAGDGSEAILAGDGSTVVVNSGQVGTNGDNSDVIAVLGDATIDINGGLVQASGGGSRGIDVAGDAALRVRGRVTSIDNDAIRIEGVGTVTVFDTGFISSEGDDGLQVDGDGSVIENAGVIQSRGDEAIEASGVNDLTVINTGTIQALAGGDKGIEAENNLTVVNSGTIFSLTSEAIEADGPGLNLTNTGNIISPLDDAVDGDDDVTIVNSGLIQGGENDGLELNSGSITNSGTIESLSSDPNGDFITSGPGTGQREIDAAIDFDGGTGNEDGTVLNLASGVIIGDIGINTSSGATGSDSNDGAQVVTNFGTITGRAVNPETGRTDAVLLGNGNDIFIQVNDGAQNGWTDGGAGTDIYAYIVTDATDRDFDLGAPIAGFEDVRVGTQSFDFATGTPSAAPATGIVTLTGTGSNAITIINTAILEGTNNATVSLRQGLGDGVAAGEVTIAASGAINTTGDGEFGFDGGDDATLTNNGSITTSGMSTAGVVLGADGTLTNSGAILSSGTNGVAVAGGMNTTMVNNAGATITTTGDNGFNTVLGGGSALTNAGIISASGAGAQAVTITGAGTVDNSGIIAAATGRAIDIAGLATVTNAAGGTLGSRGVDVVRLNAAGSTLDNAGTIRNEGAGGFGVRGTVMTTVTNSGSMTTTGDTSAVIFVGADSSVSNTGAILAEGVNGVAIAAGNNADVSNAAGATITTTGDNGFNIVLQGDGSLTNAGVISSSGADAQAVTVIGAGVIDNSGIIAAADGRALDVGGLADITNQAGGVIGSRGADTVRMNAANSTLVNAGEILNEADAGLGVRGGASNTVTNTGLISTTGDATASVLLGGNSTLANEGTIEASGDAGVAAALGAGGTLTNAAAGSITSAGDGAPTIVLQGDGTVENAGLISATGANSQAITVLGDFTLTNTGTINADDGRAIDVLGTSDLTNDTDGTITATGADAIRFIGAGSLTNRGSIEGERGVEGNTADDFVANFGSITGVTDAVVLNAGADTFQQWTGASVTGNVLLGGGDDTFVLEGLLSSISGNVDAGMGSDTAILAGTLDADAKLLGFETIQLGSTLGGTLNDLVIDGNRTLVGDVVHVGEVLVDLGVDSLTATGSITLENTGTLTIATPLDGALAGQLVPVLVDGTGFTNNGATVNIIDDDLLLDYQVVISSLSVRVVGANPFVGNADPNIARFGGALSQGINAGTISPANFAALNALTPIAAAGRVREVLPSLSDAVGREVFETSSLASTALDRHLATESSGVWGTIAVRGANQEALSTTADGYESDQIVFTMGADFALGDDIKLGLIASYADIDIMDESATGAPGTDADVESYKIGAYAAVKFFERGFVNSEVAYLTGNVDAARGGLLGPITSAYDFDGIMARTTFGYDLLADESVSLTPTIGLVGARINFDDTTETGGFGFTVQRGDAVYAETRFGLELAGQFSEMASGFISGRYIHDLVDTTRSFRLSSAQIGTFSTALPVREQDRFELNAGVSFDVSDALSIDVGYLGDFNEGYDAHSGRATLRFAF